MSVAGQMLLNQVTIFAPKSNTTRSYGGSDNPPSKTKYQHKEREDGRYAFGWADPRDIVEDK